MNSRNDIQILQTPLFVRQKKKLKKNQIKELDKAIKHIIENPEKGERKRGDLKNIWVYKFRVHAKIFLIAYLWNEKTRTLIALGMHENFYRNVKIYLDEKKI